MTTFKATIIDDGNDDDHGNEVLKLEANQNVGRDHVFLKSFDFLSSCNEFLHSD